MTDTILGDTSWVTQITRAGRAPLRETVRVTLEPQGGPPDDVRISDEERTQVVDRLRRHCAEGRITLDEFSDRAGQVYAARTRGELVEVLADLPEPVPPLADEAVACAGTRPAGWSASWAAVRARVAGGRRAR